MFQASQSHLVRPCLEAKQQQQKRLRQRNCVLLSWLSSKLLSINPVKYSLNKYFNKKTNASKIIGCFTLQYNSPIPCLFVCLFVCMFMCVHVYLVVSPQTMSTLVFETKPLPGIWGSEIRLSWPARKHQEPSLLSLLTLIFK